MHFHKLKHNWTHYLGLISSGLCFVHCLLMPLLIPFIPAVAAFAQHNIYIEGLFLILIGLTTLTIINGYRLHRYTPTLALALAGFVSLAISLWMPTATLQVLTSGLGSVFMLAAHYTNYKRCRIEAPCCPHEH